MSFFAHCSVLSSDSIKLRLNRKQFYEIKHGPFFALLWSKVVLIQARLDTLETLNTSGGGGGWGFVSSGRWGSMKSCATNFWLTHIRGPEQKHL